MSLKKWSARLGLLLALMMFTTLTANAASLTNPSFKKVWTRTDYPVQQGKADYSWVWGPQPFTGEMSEWYDDSGGGRRTVQYFDKSRMEINDPNANPNTDWYVTNGLLVKEMIQGRVQVGDARFISTLPARIAIAGDPTNTFPYYSDLQKYYLSLANHKVGDHITAGLAKSGATTFSQYANDPASQVTQLQSGFGIPRAFSDYLSRGGTVYTNNTFNYQQPLFNWLYVTGLPITEAYWTKVKVGGVEKDVMFQAFERRLLTYTPSNPAQYKVEMGNVGQHYYKWRYTDILSNAPARITNIQPGQTIKTPLLVQGFENGKAFEAAITIVLKKNDGTVLGESSTMVHRPDFNIAGPFETTLTWTAPSTAIPGKLQVVTYSANDGSEQILYSQDVIIGAA